MSLLGILIAGVLLVGSVAGFVAMERKAGADAVRAELQPKLAACEGQITALAEETAAKQATSAQALRKAEAKGKVWQDNAIRLQAVLASRKPEGPKDCKAAWQEIRK